MKKARAVAFWVLLVVAVPALAGCGSESGSAGGGGGGGGGGKTLVVDTSFVVQGLDPEAFHTPTQLMADKGIYDTLLTQGKGGKVVTSLARSFHESPDAKVFTFKLRSGVKFADGTPLTSADVAFSFNRLINLKSEISNSLAGVTVSTPSPSTVVLKTATSNPAIPQILTMPTLGILNSKLLKANGGTDAANAAKTDKAAHFFNTESAGSGPYTLKSYETNSQITLQANPNYWGPQPHFTTVVIRNMQAPTQLLNVQRGSNEVAVDLSGQQASTLKGDSNVEVHITPSPDTFFLALNMDSKVSAVSSNPHIQAAVRHAINDKAMLQIAGSGAIPSAGVIPSMVLGALPPPKVAPPDVAKAKAEVAASGLSNPSLVLSYPSDLSVNGVQFATLAQRVKIDLAAVGITITLQGLPTTTFLTKYEAGQLAFNMVYWFINYPDPTNATSFMPGGNYAVRVKWEKGASPALEKQANKAVSTANDGVRKRLWQQIQRELNQSSPWVPLFQPAQAIVGSANLTNLALSPVWILDVAAVGSK